MSVAPYQRIDRVKPSVFVFNPYAQIHWRWNDHKHF